MSKTDEPTPPIAYAVERPGGFPGAEVLAGEVAKPDASREDWLLVENVVLEDKLTRLTARVQELEAFKAYAHQRLDDAGIPTHPDGPHSAAGCRVGDLLDIALDKLRGWQPIETAPRDGTEFQAWARYGWEPRARVNPETESLETYGRVDYDMDGWMLESDLTHWQPLPAPPTEKDAA